MNQKTFKMNMNPGDKTPRKRAKFTQNEDAKLIELVSKYGEDNWTKIAELMKNRTPRQCRERWRYYLNPRILSQPWNMNDDYLLIQKVNQLGKKWTKIAIFFPGRTDISIKNRWLTLQRRQLKCQNLPQSNNLSIETTDIQNPPEIPQIQKKVIPPIFSAEIVQKIYLDAVNEGILKDNEELCDFF